MTQEITEEIVLEKNVKLAQDEVKRLFTERFGDTRERDEILIMVGELISKKILLKIIESLKGLSRANFVTYINLERVEDATSVAMKNEIDINTIAREVSEEVLRDVLGEDFNLKENTEKDIDDNTEESEMDKNDEEEMEKHIKKVMSLTGLIPDDEETVEEFLERAMKRKEELDQEEKDLENKKLEQEKIGEALSKEDEAKLEEIKKLREELAKL